MKGNHARQWRELRTLAKVLKWECVALASLGVVLWVVAAATTGQLARTPHWGYALAGFIGALFAWALEVGAQHLARKQAGLCPCCGYDRGGLAEGAKCPECGRTRTQD